MIAATLVLLPLALASPVELVARQATGGYTAVSGLIGQTITDIIALNTTVSSYGTNVTDLGSGLIGTYNGAQAVATDLQNTVNSVSASSPFTSTESQNLYLSLASLLEPTFNLLDNFVAHCNSFANVGIKSIVLQNLQQQRVLVQQEGSGLAGKVAAPYPKSVSFGAGLILSKFDVAIGVFAASSCPPPGSTAFPSGGSGGATVTVTAPGSTVTAPGGTITKTVTLAGGVSTVTLPGGTITKTLTLGGGSGPTVTATVTAPGATVTLPGGTVTKTVTDGGAGPTITIPGPTITAPGATITKTSTLTQAGGSCSKKPTSTICFFWQPCFGKTKRDAAPEPTALLL